MIVIAAFLVKTIAQFNMVYDCIVVGKGLMGSAAAKYLAQSLKNVAIIGPDEPTDLSTATVFASHYDQARIQRQIGLDEVWTLLNIQSTGIYQQLENQSGIQFHDAIGCLYVQPDGLDDYLKMAPSQAKQFNIDCRFFNNGESIHKAFPQYVFPDASHGMIEMAPSGSINPRLLIKAQLEVFKQKGGQVFAETVSAVDYGKDKIDVTTFDGNVFSTKKILLAPGSFSNFLPVPEGKKLALTLKSETIVLAKINETEAKRLSKLPSLLYEINTKNLDGIYLVRPIKYPDGNYYIKMGCNFPADIYFEDLADIKKWFLKGNSDMHLQDLKNALITILPKVVFEDFITKRCIITRTPHGKQYIGELNRNVIIATGGNGYSAMCSDALGRIASHVVINNAFSR